jgi:hypothetical protein
MKILVGVDGPKENEIDSRNVREVLDEVQKIDWTDDVEVRSRKSNLGIRKAVPDSVSWAIDKYGVVIVLEDDIRPGSEFFEFMNFCLKEYRNTEQIGHISGYNLVPEKFISSSTSMVRSSIYPESYAWGTWGRAWDKYSDSLEWALDLSRQDLQRIVVSKYGAKVWERNFRDAESESISTWAYRWIASMWKNSLLSVSPNRSISSYQGQEGGTHTRSSPRWDEQPIQSVLKLNSETNPKIDLSAEAWIEENVFRGTSFGSVRRVFESAILNILKKN